MSETIINGIDVSECKNFSCGICEEENKIPRTIGHFTADCTFYPNCYFKQLKHLQQKIDIKEKMLDKFMIGSGEILEKLQKENQELGKIINCKTGTIQSLAKIRDDLKQENEKLKEKIDIYENSIIANHDGAVGKRLMEILLALEEIKTYINQECENKQCPQTCANCFMGNVLIKVNEVLNDRN